jgi:hypothetical protein
MPKSVGLARQGFTGLCTTCVNAPECTLPRNRSVPVLDCLEFDGELRNSNGVRKAAAHGQDPPLAREPGLCSWCEHQAACTFPKPPAGVWMCEEFC